MCGKHEKGSGSESRPQFSEPGRVTWSLSFGFCIRQMKITTLFLHERLLPVAFRAHQLHILISKYFMYDIHYNSFFFNYSICSMDVELFSCVPAWEYWLNLFPFFSFWQFIALELHVQVSILYMPPSVQVLAFSGFIPRGGTAGRTGGTTGVCPTTVVVYTGILYRGDG